MTKAKEISKALVLLLALCFFGECFQFLLDSGESISASSWIITGYFAAVFILTCLFFYWRRKDNAGKRLLLLLLLWLLSWVLEFTMAALGVNMALQKVFHIQEIGEFGTAAVVMLKGCVLFSAMLSAAVVSQFALTLFRRRKKQADSDNSY